jgi:hypothetical protein
MTTEAPKSIDASEENIVLPIEVEKQDDSKKIPRVKRSYMPVEYEKR